MVIPRTLAGCRQRILQTSLGGRTFRSDIRTAKRFNNLSAPHPFAPLRMRAEILAFDLLACTQPGTAAFALNDLCIEDSRGFSGSFDFDFPASLKTDNQEISGLFRRLRFNQRLGRFQVFRTAYPAHPFWNHAENIERSCHREQLPPRNCREATSRLCTAQEESGDRQWLP